ncbi:MAG: hypothetical protein ACR2PZ_12925 [Pseudomonadales bacterium]
MTSTKARPRAFGASVWRTEDRRFVTGQGRYTDDVTLPGQTYAQFVRSPVAHGKIVGFDIDSALAVPGVIKVLTGAVQVSVDYEDLPAVGNQWDCRCAGRA